MTPCAVFISGFSVGIICAMALYHYALVGYEVRRAVEGS